MKKILFLSLITLFLSLVAVGQNNYLSRYKDYAKNVYTWRNFSPIQQTFLFSGRSITGHDTVFLKYPFWSFSGQVYTLGKYVISSDSNGAIHKNQLKPREVVTIKKATTRNILLVILIHLIAGINMFLASSKASVFMKENISYRFRSFLSFFGKPRQALYACFLSFLGSLLSIYSFSFPALIFPPTTIGDLLFIPSILLVCFLASVVYQVQYKWRSDREDLEDEMIEEGKNMKVIITVVGMPSADKSDFDYNDRLKAIKETLINEALHAGRNIYAEDDMICVIPQEKWDQKEITIFVDGVYSNPSRKLYHKKELANEMVKIMATFFPDHEIKCVVGPFDHLPGFTRRTKK